MKLEVTELPGESSLSGNRSRGFFFVATDVGLVLEFQVESFISARNVFTGWFEPSPATSVIGQGL